MSTISQMGELDLRICPVDTYGMSEDFEEATREELYEQAQEEDIPGRSNMTKDELAAALKEQSKTATPGELTDLAKWRRDDYEGGRPADD